MTDIPIVGHIPHCNIKNNFVVLEESDSFIAEPFRSLRSKLEFFTKEAKTPVILITSSIPEEGKTFTAINLASAYSLIGFDMRKPKIYDDFSLSNEQGVSTWLTGNDGLENIIKETPYQNLFIVPAGPVPPNPSELSVFEKTNDLVKLLKDRFDCIIIDSSPIGTVSDAFHISTMADVCLLIVRQYLTFKDPLENTLEELKLRAINCICIVFNDLEPDYKLNSYSGNYGGYRNVYGKEKKG